MAMRLVAVFHLPISFILIASFVTVTVSYIDIDMEQCSNCSERADVPCIVQQVSHYCHHPMFSTSWPGAPRDLTARSLKQNGKWFANFTWKPPYDSSLKSLEGFHLTVNVLDQEMSGTGHPDCFFINLTQVDWTKVEDKHNVVFHFDCISSENPVTLFVMVTSSPAPIKKPLRQEIALQLPGVSKKNYEPDWNVTINIRKVVVNGCPEVQVRFEPLYPNANAHAVLVYPVQSDAPIESVELKVIQPDNVEFFMWRANESVFIEECIPPKPEVPKSPGVDNYIALIIVSCIFLVAIFTACTFCLIRTRHNDMDSFNLFLICKTRPPERYVAAETGEAPNNMPDFASETKRVLSVLHSNHPIIKQACQALCHLLQKTNTVDVLTTEEILSNRDPLNTTHLQDIPLVILDEIMMQLWKDDSNVKSIHDPTTEALANIIRMIKKTHHVDDILFVSLFSREQRCWNSLIPDIGKKLYYICSKRNNVEQDYKLKLNPSVINELLAQLPGYRVECIWNNIEEARAFERSVQFLIPTCEDDDVKKCENSMLGLESASAVDGERYSSWSSSLSSPSLLGSPSPIKSPHRKSNETQTVHPKNECSLHYPNDSGHVFHGMHSTEKWVEQQNSTSSDIARVKPKLCSTSDCTTCQTEPLLRSGVCVHKNGSAMYIREKSIANTPHFPKIDGYSNAFIPCHNGQIVTGNGIIHSPYHLDSCNARSGQINRGVMAGRYNSCGCVIHSAMTGSSVVRYEDSDRDHRCRMHHECNCGCDQSEEFIGPESDEESTTDSVVYKRLMDLNKRNGYLPQKEDV